MVPSSLDISSVCHGCLLEVKWFCHERWAGWFVWRLRYCRWVLLCVKNLAEYLLVFWYLCSFWLFCWKGCFADCHPSWISLIGLRTSWLKSRITVGVGCRIWIWIEPPFLESQKQRFWASHLVSLLVFLRTTGSVNFDRNRVVSVLLTI